jgi:hypothetical protein
MPSFSDDRPLRATNPYRPGQTPDRPKVVS